MLEQLAVLDRGKLHRDTAFDLAHNTCPHLAERNAVAHFRHDVGRDGRTGKRHIDNSAHVLGAVGQNDLRDRVLGNEPVVPTIFGKIEFVAVGQPRQNIGDLVALARGVSQFNGKTAIDQAGNLALNPAQVVKIGDDPFSDPARNRCDHCHAPGGHVDHLTWIFMAVFQHEAAENVDPDALMPPLISGIKRFATISCCRQAGSHA